MIVAESFAGPEAATGEESSADVDTKTGPMLMGAPQTSRVGKEKPHEGQTPEPQPSPPQAGRCREHLSKGQAAIPSGKAALDQLMLSQGYQQRHSSH